MKNFIQYIDENIKDIIKQNIDPEKENPNWEKEQINIHQWMRMALADFIQTLEGENYFFFSTMLKNITLIPTETYPIMATDGPKIFYNPKTIKWLLFRFVNTKDQKGNVITREQSIDLGQIQIQFVFLHEILHNFFTHINLRNFKYIKEYLSKEGVDVEGFEFEQWNIACDLYINNWLTKSHLYIDILSEFDINDISSKINRGGSSSHIAAIAIRSQSSFKLESLGWLNQVDVSNKVEEDIIKDLLKQDIDGGSGKCKDGKCKAGKGNKDGEGGKDGEDSGKLGKGGREKSDDVETVNIAGEFFEKSFVRDFGKHIESDSKKSQEEHREFMDKAKAALRRQHKNSDKDKDRAITSEFVKLMSRKKSAVDWKQKLSLFINSNVESAREIKDVEFDALTSSVIRSNAVRFPNAEVRKALRSIGLIKSRYDLGINNLIIGVDVSGSCWNYVKGFFAEISSIFRQLDDTYVGFVTIVQMYSQATVIDSDVIILTFDDIKSGNIESKLAERSKVSGGGAYDSDAVFQYIHQENINDFNCVIVLTDDDDQVSFKRPLYHEKVLFCIVDDNEAFIPTKDGEWGNWLYIHQKDIT